MDEIGVGDWRSFAAALALTLAKMPGQATLVVVGAEDRYAAFWFAVNGLWCEVVSDYHLAEDYRMGPEGEVRMVAGGWHLPLDGCDTDNWHREVLRPARYRDYEVLAERVVSALHDLLRIERPADLEFNVIGDSDFDISALTGA